jgi:hypothetical protein
MYNIHPTDFLIFSFDREAFQSKVLFQCPPSTVDRFLLINWKIAFAKKQFAKAIPSGEGVKGGFQVSLHTLLMIHNKLRCDDRSEGSFNERQGSDQKQYKSPAPDCRLPSSP